MGIQLVDTGECLLTDGFLVVCEEESPEFSPLEKVLAVVIGLGGG